jgi:hypothetical protein
MLPEKRQFERSEAFLIVEFKPSSKTTEYSLGVTGNISMGGFSLDYQGLDFRQGETLECNLKHPESMFSVSAVGEIVWRKDSWYNCAAGIKFIEIAEDAKNRISDFIAMHRNKPFGFSLNKNAGVPIIQADKEQSKIIDKIAAEKTVKALTPDINVDEPLDKGEIAYKGQAAAGGMPAAYAKRKKKNRSYVPVIAVVVILLGVALYLKSGIFKEGDKDITPPSTGADSARQSGNADTSTSDDKAKTRGLSVQQLTESEQPQNVMIQESEKENSLPPIANSIPSDSKKDNPVSPDVNIQNGHSAVQESQKPKQLQPLNNADEATKLPVRNELGPQESISGISEKTEREIKPVVESKIETVSAASAPQKNIVIHEEAFNNNENNWDIFDTNMASAKIKGGEYLIENKRKKGPHVIFYHYDFPIDSNFITEASIRAVTNANNYSYGLVVKNPDNRSYGIVFGGRDALNNYTFRIRENGFYSISKYRNGALQELAGGKIKNTVYNQNAANILKIIKQGNMIRFYINANPIDEISNLPFFGKKAGFIVDGATKIAVEKTRTQIQ